MCLDSLTPTDKKTLNPTSGFGYKLFLRFPCVVAQEMTPIAVAKYRKPKPLEP